MFPGHRDAAIAISLHVLLVIFHHQQKSVIFDAEGAVVALCNSLRHGARAADGRRPELSRHFSLWLPNVCCVTSTAHIASKFWATNQMRAISRRQCSPSHPACFIITIPNRSWSTAAPFSTVCGSSNATLVQNNQDRQEFPHNWKTQKDGTTGHSATCSRNLLYRLFGEAAESSSKTRDCADSGAREIHIVLAWIDSAVLQAGGQYSSEAILLWCSDMAMPFRSHNQQNIYISENARHKMRHIMFSSSVLDQQQNWNNI